MTKKIVFMGTPEFAVKPLEALYNSKDIEIGFVVTGKDKERSRGKFTPTPVKEKALELGLESFEPENVNSKDSLEKIFAYNPDLIVVIAYGQLIKDELLRKFKDRIVNIHSSLLPKYRGAAPMQWTILNKEEKAGVCSMLIEKSMDTGDILACTEIPLSRDTDIQTLHDKLSEEAANLIVKTVLNFDIEYSNRVKQDDNLASYSKKITKEMGHIDFREKAEDILAKIMAFSLWPSTFVNYEDKIIKIHKIDIIDKYNDCEESVIIDANFDGIFVNCKDKCIVIKEIQLQGKKKMEIRAFLLGNSVKIGSKFN